MTARRTGGQTLNVERTRTEMALGNWRIHGLGKAARRRRSAVMAAVAALALVLSGLSPLRASAGLLPTSRVILTGPGIPVETQLVNRAGGQIDVGLPLIHAVSTV